MEPTVVAGLIGAVLGGGGLGAIVTAMARRGVTRVEAVDWLSESTREWADDLKAEAADARKEAANARREAVAAHEEMAAVRSEARALAWELRRLRLTIMDPAATMERLRAMVGEGPANGVVPRVPEAG